MSAARSKDRLSLCSFTFADGRRCRMTRQSGHPFLCCFHARKEAQAQAAEEVGRDIRFLLSGDYLSAGDLSLALGRVFAAAARGQLKPKTAGTLAYLGQTLLQTIQLAQHEYINAFSTDSWRRVIFSHVKENTNYLFPAPPPDAAAPVPSAVSVPAQTAEQLPPEAASQALDEPHASVKAGLQPGSSSSSTSPTWLAAEPSTQTSSATHEGPGVSDRANAPVRPNLTGRDPEPGVLHGVSPSAGRNSSQAGQEPAVSNHAAVPAQSSSPTEPHPAPPSMMVSPSAQSSDLPAVADPPAVAGSAPAPARLPRRAAEFAATILASAPSSKPQRPRPKTTKAHSAPPAAEAAPPTGPSGLPLLAALPPCKLRTPSNSGSA